MTYYVGSEVNATALLGDHPTYFYALRRTDEGELYFTRVNQALDDDTIQINYPGNSEDDYPDFSSGEDFFEGRDVNHNLVYPNLNYEQIKWDHRNLYYYMNSEGELVVRIGKAYPYNTSDNI